MKHGPGILIPFYCRIGFDCDLYEQTTPVFGFRKAGFPKKPRVEKNGTGISPIGKIRPGALRSSPPPSGRRVWAAPGSPRPMTSSPRGRGDTRADCGVVCPPFAFLFFLKLEKEFITPGHVFFFAGALAKWKLWLPCWNNPRRGRPQKIAPGIQRIASNCKPRSVILPSGLPNLGQSPAGNSAATFGARESQGAAPKL